MVRISSLINRDGARRLREETKEAIAGQRGLELEEAIVRHFDAIHAATPPTDVEIERLFLANEEEALRFKPGNLPFSPGVFTVSPSAASKCDRELFYKAAKAGKDVQPFYPYQNRWMRNGSAVHAATQKDLLYGEKYLSAPSFTVERTVAGQPAWEKNIATVRQFTYDGVMFQIYGMMDGILRYRPDGSRVGFEFKTKSTTVAAIGPFKLKEVQAAHREQCIAYSLLFDVTEFLIMYESLAKDGWNKGDAAKPDLRAFYVNVTPDDQRALLDKFARVARHYYEEQLPPPDFGKCTFCPYKTRCHTDMVAM